MAPVADPSPQVTSSSAAVAGATPVSTVEEPRIGGIIWTTATDPTTNAPVDAVTNYQSDAPRLIAAVQAHALPAGSVVGATWEYNDTSLDAFTTRLTAPGSDAEHWMNFHIARDSDVPWPVGTYEVAISLDGTRVQEANVEVVEQP